MEFVEQYVPAWLLACLGVVIVLSTLAALARKPPLTWVGHWVAWIFRRLVGQPLAQWGKARLEDEVRPIIAQEVTIALSDHMTNEETVIRSMDRKLDGLATTVLNHVEEDRAAFRNINTKLLVITKNTTETEQ